MKWLQARLAVLLWNSRFQRKLAGRHIKGRPTKSKLKWMKKVIRNWRGDATRSVWNDQVRTATSCDECDCADAWKPQAPHVEVKTDRHVYRKEYDFDVMAWTSTPVPLFRRERTRATRDYPATDWAPAWHRRSAEDIGQSRHCSLQLGVTGGSSSTSLDEWITTRDVRSHRD